MSQVFGQKMRFLRRYCRLSQAQVGKIMHLDRSSIAYYETGKVEPKISSLLAFARLYRVTLESLCDDSLPLVFLQEKKRDDPIL